jgi:superfamily II DNA or RNA helicase
MHHHTVNVNITNQTATLSRIENYDTKLRSYWSYSVENYNHILRAKPYFRQCRICHLYPSQHRHKVDHDYVPVWDGRISLFKRGQVPAGLFWATCKDIEKKENIKFKIKTDVDIVENRSKRKWLVSDNEYKFQNDCVTLIHLNASMGRGGLILNATGSGKTRIAAMAASRLDCEILFIVDQLVLLRQAQKEISNNLKEEVGYVGESKFRLQRVTVATIQTLHLHLRDPKFLRWFRAVQVIFIDEIHEMINKSNFSVVQTAKPLCVFGLTATLGLSRKPTRLKAYSLCGPVIYEYPVQRGMKEGVLSQGLCIQLEYENSIKHLEDWTQPRAYRKRIVKNGERNYVITQLTKYAVRNGKYVCIVVERLKHLEEISERLKDLHVKHKVVAGTYKGKGIKVKERFKSKDKFEEGKIRCLVVNKVFKKGIDIKRLDLIINAAGKPSVNDAIQVFGRGVRRHKDKVGLICFDVNDVDSRDKERRHRKEKQNWLSVSAKRRIRALKKAGIIVRKIVWNEDLSFNDILKQAEKYLQKELQDGKV